MERETITITTPVSNETVILKAWITAGEKRGISDIFIGNSSFDANSKQFNFTDPGVMNRLRDQEIKNVVVSINGDTENVVERSLNMRVEDFDFILNEVEKIVNPELKKK